MGVAAEERDLLGEARFPTAKPAFHFANTGEGDPGVPRDEARRRMRDVGG